MKPEVQFTQVRGNRDVSASQNFTASITGVSTRQPRRASCRSNGGKRSNRLGCRAVLKQKTSQTQTVSTESELRANSSVFISKFTSAIPSEQSGHLSLKLRVCATFE
ncbi:hypothetical protein BaRGS_00029980, partial [Batillaria attramentaria]